jgi:hypothetical protein
VTSNFVASGFLLLVSLFVRNRHYVLAYDAFIRQFGHVAVACFGANHPHSAAAFTARENW